LVNFNRLVANLSKSNYLLIDCDSNKKLELHIDIRETDSLKILRVKFDKRLSFHYHTEKVSNKVEAILRIRNLLPQNTNFNLQNSYSIEFDLFMSGLGPYLWNPSQKIQIIQKMALRIITSNDCGTDVTNLYNKLKIMNIFDIISYYSNVYIYKSFHKLNSFLSANFFKLVNRSQRSWSTQRQMLALPKCKFNYTQNSIFYKGVQSWNSLDIEIRSLSNIRLLKNKLLGQFLINFNFRSFTFLFYSFFKIVDICKITQTRRTLVELSVKTLFQTLRHK
jgi:hypothetical protein